MSGTSSAKSEATEETEEVGPGSVEGSKVGPAPLSSLPERNDGEDGPQPAPQ